MINSFSPPLSPSLSPLLPLLLLLPTLPSLTSPLLPPSLLPPLTFTPLPPLLIFFNIDFTPLLCELVTFASALCKYFQHCQEEEEAFSIPLPLSPSSILTFDLLVLYESICKITTFYLFNKVEMIIMEEEEEKDREILLFNILNSSCFITSELLLIPFLVHLSIIHSYSAIMCLYLYLIEEEKHQLGSHTVRDIWKELKKKLYI